MVGVMKGEGKVRPFSSQYCHRLHVQSTASQYGQDCTVQSCRLSCGVDVRWVLYGVAILSTGGVNPSKRGGETAKTEAEKFRGWE